MSDNVEIVKKTQPLKRRQKLAMALLGVVILSSGFVLGASVTFFVLRERIRPVPPPFPSERILEGLTKDLQLNEDQQEQVKNLFDDLHEKFTIVREEVGKEMTGHRKGMDARMKTILTEEQFSKWESYKARMERRRKGRWGRGREGERRGGGRGPGGNRGGRGQRPPHGNSPPDGPEADPKPNNGA